MAGNSDSDWEYQHTTDYLKGGDTVNWHGMKVQCIGMQHDCGASQGSGYYMKIKTTFPNGRHFTKWYWTGAWFRVSYWSNETNQTITNTPCDETFTFYDGEYSYVPDNFKEGFIVDCIDAADFDGLSNDSVKLLLQHKIEGNTIRYLDNVAGDDDDFGITWDRAWKTLHHTANNTLAGEDVYIATGDYKISPSATNDSIAPVNVGAGGDRIAYVITDHNNTGLNYMECGKISQSAIFDFKHSGWGSHVRYYFDNLEKDANTNIFNFKRDDWGSYLGYYHTDGSTRYIKKLTSSSCTFVDEDVGFSETGMLLHVTEDKEPFAWFEEGDWYSFHNNYWIKNNKRLASTESDPAAEVEIYHGEELVDTIQAYNSVVYKYEVDIEGELIPVVVFRIGDTVVLTGTFGVTDYIVGKGLEYINGLEASRTTLVDSDVNIGSGNLMYVYNDNDYEYTTYTGTYSIWYDGWEILFKELLESGGQDHINFVVYHNDVEKGNYYVAEGEDLIHKETVNGTDIPIIATHVTGIFRGGETNSVQTKGSWQCSHWYFDTDVDTT